MGFLMEKRKTENQNRRNGLVGKAQPATAGFEYGGTGHEPQNTGSLQKLERARREIFLPKPPENDTTLQTPWF